MSPGALVEIEERPPAFVLRMGGTGLFNLQFLEEFGAALDRVEATSGPACIVVTGEDRSFSAGFDLGALTTESGELVSGGIALLGRMLAIGIPSAAAMNGHAFGIGAMLALACDFRVMREDRGYFCLPEIDLEMSLAPPMMALLQAKLQPDVLSDALLSGRRIGGLEAAELAIVDACWPAQELLAQAVGCVEPLSDKDRATYAALKRGLYRQPLGLVEGGIAPH
jgi:enoyl-CoA hydratase/carnithine racemase